MKNWYIVQSYSSFEKKVADAIKKEAIKAKLEDKIEEVLVPTHEVTEVRRGKRVQRKKKYFPGYVLVKMDMDNQLYHLIKNIKKVSGFLGQKGNPLLVPEKEIEAEVPMLDINFGSETGMSEETDFARKLKDNQEIKQAEKEYNIHIQAMVQPKLGGFDPELFVRIELEIETSGKITSFRLLEQSSSNSFNQAAELAIRNANLNLLPKALAKNPPYIVVVRIIPPIQ